MINILIDNSTSSVTGLSVDQTKDLKNILCYYEDPQAMYFSGNHRSPKRYLLDKKGNFPTGLLYLVEEYVAKNKIDAIVIDKRVVPKRPLKLLDISLDHRPYDEQYEAAVSCIVETRGIVCAPTGVGKSIIIALIIKGLSLPTLVVVPTLALKQQLTDMLQKAFKKVTVGGLGSFIAVENVDAIDLYEPLTNYNCVIIDEFHHSGAATYRRLNKHAWSTVYYKFGLTATPYRTQDNERLLLESVLSKVVYNITHKECVEKGYIVPIASYYVQLPKKEVTGYTWAQVYSELVVNNKERNELIAMILKRMFKEGIPTLCLVKEIKHGQILSDLTGIPFANGEEGNAKELIAKFNSKALSCLIGTSGVLGEGVDTRPAELIVIAGLGKAKGQFMQNCGRGFRKFEGKEACQVILFKDDSHKFTSKHFKEQVKHLRQEYGVTPVRLDFGCKKG